MEKDITQNAYFSDRERFADLINGYVGQGERLISPQDLQSVDPRSGMYKIVGFEGAPDALQKEKEQGKKVRPKIRYRDIKMCAAFGKNVLVIGLENQETVDYSLPVRVLSSDAGDYGQQVSGIRKRILSMKNKKGLRPGEYLYGFKKNSRLFPVMTFVIYYGEEEWDGARDLHSLLRLTDIPEKLQKLLSNHSVNLIEVRKLEDTSVFKTDVRQVFDFIRYSNDKEKLKELVENDPAYQNLAEDAYDVIVQYANAGELIKEKEAVKGKDGRVNMCRALTELIADGRTQGRNEGIAIGESRGIAIGVSRGEARLNNLNQHLINENRFDDLKRAVNDSKYRKKLFAEFNL